MCVCVKKRRVAASLHTSPQTHFFTFSQTLLNQLFIFSTHILTSLFCFQNSTLVFHLFVIRFQFLHNFFSFFFQPHTVFNSSSFTSPHFNFNVVISTSVFIQQENSPLHFIYLIVMFQFLFHFNFSFQLLSSPPSFQFTSLFFFFF